MRRKPIPTRRPARTAAVPKPTRLVLVTAATGYIGKSIVRPLEAAGYRVRAAARSPEKLVGIVTPETEVVTADGFDEPAVAASLAGVDTAYYLIHTLAEGADYAARDRESAEIFARAAAEAGVRRIVFFGGLGVAKENLSEHLAEPTRGRPRPGLHRRRSHRVPGVDRDRQRLDLF